MLSRNSTLSRWLVVFLFVATFFLPFNVLGSTSPISAENSGKNFEINLGFKDSESETEYYLKPQSHSKRLKLPPLWNAVRASIKPAGLKGLEYSFLLKGLDDKWSAWSASKTIQYSGLKDGDYELRAKIRNTRGELLEEKVLWFTLLPPWYKTTWANLAFLFMGGILVYFLFKNRFNYFLLTDNHNELPNFIDDYKSDGKKILSSLQREELIAEVNSKNKELAVITMQMAERGKLFSRIKEELVLILKNTQQHSEQGDFRTVLRMLNDAEKSRQDWEQFSIHFDEVHTNFLSALKSRYPALSITDLKLSAYLRLNLSSKEIAQSMNITVKGVEVSRYRLRKKLNISKEINLFDFLLQVTNSDIPDQSTFAQNVENLDDDLARFLSFFNNSMTAKFISQGCYDLSSEGIIFKRSVAHNKR